MRSQSYREFLEWLKVKPTYGQEILLRMFDGERPKDMPAEFREDAKLCVGGVEDWPDGIDHILAVVAGRRAGKSYILSALPLLYQALTVDISSLAPGEFAAAILVAPDIRLARQTSRYILGAVQKHPVLKKYLKSGNVDGMVLERPGEGTVIVEILPATRGGSALRGRAVVGAVMDEAAFFYDEDHVVNDDEIFRALIPALLPGGRIFISSSPYAEKGLLWDLYKKNFGHPTSGLVFWAPSAFMRPQLGKLIERERLRDPDNAQREYDARFVSANSGIFFDPRSVDASIVQGIDPTPPPGAMVTVGCDFGFQSDSSACVVVHRVGATRRVAEIVELRPRPDQPLKPSEVVETFAEVAKRHGASAVVADAHYRMAIHELLATYDLGLVPAPEGQKGKALTYQFTRQLMNQGLVQLPDHDRLLGQIREVEYRPTSGGGISLSSPRKRSGGHGDLVSAMVLALYQYGGGGFEIADPGPRRGSRAWHQREEERLLDERIALVAARNRGPLEMDEPPALDDVSGLPVAWPR